MREALAERARILKLAPHLVRIEPFLFPLFGRPVLTRGFYQAGMTLYDVLGAHRDGGWHRRRSVGATLGHAPALRRKGLRGGLVFHDAVHDDARYVLSVARTAELAGGGRRDPGGRRVADRGERARRRRAGPRRAWRRHRGRPCPRRRRRDRRLGGRPASPLRGGSTPILPSRGTHLVVRRERIPSDIGLTIRVPGKVVFLVPWPRHWLIGTTDNAYDGPIDRPHASPDEVAELIAR